MSTLTGAILTSKGWIQGTLYREGKIIVRIEGNSVEEQHIQPPYILPGFIDLHVHGGGGRDVMEGGDALKTIAHTHAQHGTTTLLATTMTANHTDILNALEGIAAFRQWQSASSSSADSIAADVIGVHLEGPYINPDKLGAQPDATRICTVEELQEYQHLAPLKVITLAPECLQENGALEWLLAQGVRVQAGHTLADYDTAEHFYHAGVKGFTHLYNAMTPFSHRAPGILGFALANAEYAEVIPDLEHVHQGALDVAFRAIPRLYAITDGTAACGMPDGEYRLGTQQVFKHGRCVRLKNGALAGSTLTLDQAIRNLVSIGRSLADASARVSTIPAQYLGLEDRGQLREGYRADMVVLDEYLELQQIYGAGQAVL